MTATRESFAMTPRMVPCGDFILKSIASWKLFTRLSISGFEWQNHLMIGMLFGLGMTNSYSTAIGPSIGAYPVPYASLNNLRAASSYFIVFGSV